MKADTTNLKKTVPPAVVPSIIDIGPTSIMEQKGMLPTLDGGSSYAVEVSKNILRKRKKKQSLREVYLDERTNAKSTVPCVAPVTEDSMSVDSGTNKDNCTDGQRLWNRVYVPKPIVQSTLVAAFGLFMFTLAMLWPYLLLLLFVVASYVLVYCFRENDSAGNRRKLYQQFINDSKDDLPQSFRELLQCKEESVVRRHTFDSSYSVAPDSSFARMHKLKFEEDYWSNARGMLLHTVMMTPTNQPTKAVVCFCHGYTDNVSYMKLASYSRLVETGVALVAIEYEGHGLSDGLLGYVNDWNLVIDDVTSYFTYILGTKRCLQHLPTFLMGESMGGAIAYDVYNRIPHVFRGVIFLSPMCKISDDMLPAPFIIDCLKRLLETFPWLGYLPIAPSKASLDDVCYKVETKRIEASLAPLNYSRSPRLATARELIDSTQRISESLCDFDAPFLILHGKADVVTDPNLSQQLFDESQSLDKTIKLYDDMWHSLLGGEPEDNVEVVLNDISQWIKERSSGLAKRRV